ncbi:Bifunctional phosphatase IMPL2, chloroplastic [Orobanche hederae]
MLSHSNFLSLKYLRTSHPSSPPAIPRFLFSGHNRLGSVLNYDAIQFNSTEMTSVRSSLSNGDGCSNQALAARLDNYELDLFADAGNKLADAAGDVIRQYFRKSFDILDKEDSSPVTIADRAAEESMVKIIQEHFPSHAIYGEENGWMCKEDFADFVWVLDPIDGTKSFITGKPLFGTLIALLHKGKPILGIIDQPILRERWIGIIGRRTALNGQEIAVRSCSQISKAYLYTTSPHLFSGGAEVAFARVRSKV